MAALTAVALGITLSLLLGGAFGPAAATGAAPAATPNATSGATASTIFGCRASVARVALAGQSVVEPGVANATTSASNSPCADDTAAVQQTGLAGSSSPLNLGTVGPAGASTFETGSLGGVTSPAATAVATVNAVSLSIGGYTISVAGQIQAQAAIECVGTALMQQATSNVDAVTIAGAGIPGGSETLDVSQLTNQLPAALAALISIQANETIPGTNSLTQRALDITLLSGAGQIVIGEATVNVLDASVCSGNVPPNSTGTTTTVTSTTGSTTTITGSNGTTTTVTTGGTPGGTTTVLQPTGTVPSYLQECPTGATLDPTSGDCVIYYQGQTIYVSKPFKGPTGGTVVPLAAAQAKFKSSCLAGAGPNYVLLVTAVNAVAKGTPSSDRILGLNTGQHISGLAGDDCIDEQSANGKVVDGNGKDRIYVTSGSNRVVAGNGPNTIHGGNGKNWITDGTGDDYIYGGSLPNRIDAYGNEKHIYGGKSNDRIWTNSIRAFVSCGGGTANVLFGREKIIAYGKKHGCQKLGRLK
jgi:hypothetical protein